MARTVYACKSCCAITKWSGRSTWTSVAKWTAFVMGMDWPLGSCGKKVLNYQIFISYLQLAERLHLHAALHLFVHEWCCYTPKEWFCEDIQKLPGRWQRCTGLFISPSGTSELDCATTKKDRAERSISIGRESLKAFFCTRGLGVLADSTARG